MKIPAVLERCAGIDIGKREIAVAIITGPADQDGEVQTRTFSMTVPALEELREWLLQEGCTSVAMESTGSYWIPIKNVLEGSVEIVLVCAKKHMPERGDKPDFRDAEHLAHLHRHGLLKGSCGVTGSDTAQKEAAEQSGGGEEPDAESVGGNQCQDRQHR